MVSQRLHLWIKLLQEIPADRRLSVWSLGVAVARRVADIATVVVIVVVFGFMASTLSLHVSAHVADAKGIMVVKGLVCFQGAIRLNTVWVDVSGDKPLTPAQFATAGAVVSWLPML